MDKFTCPLFSTYFDLKSRIRGLQCHSAYDFKAVNMLTVSKEWSRDNHWNKSKTSVRSSCRSSPVTRNRPDIAFFTLNNKPQKVLKQKFIWKLQAGRVYYAWDICRFTCINYLSFFFTRVATWQENRYQHLCDTIWPFRPTVVSA